MNKKIVFFTTLLGIGILSFAYYADAASLPKIFELPFNTDLRRGNIVAFIGDLIRTALFLVGAILLVIIVYAGFVYATAMGDDKRVTKAKNTLTYAVIGIVIISGAFIIADFLIQNIVK